MILAHLFPRRGPSESEFLEALSGFQSIQALRFPLKKKKGPSIRAVEGFPRRLPPAAAATAAAMASANKGQPIMTQPIVSYPSAAFPLVCSPDFHVGVLLLIISPSL